MGNKIITEKDFWICTLGNVPAQLQGTREGSKKKSGEKYITVEDKATSSWIDFGCKKYMLLMAIVAAVLVVGAVVLGVVTVATGGAALIAIGALAGLAGAAIGAVMGGLLCGQKMGGGRKWLGNKKDLIIQGSPGITGGHQMKCKVGGVITFAPHIKNWSQAVSLGAANYIGGLMEGMMAGAAIGMGGAALSGGSSVFASAGWRGLGRAALNFGKSIPTNLKVNFIESFSKFGLGMRGVMGVQNTAATYGNTGEASITDFAKGTVAMETGAYDSAKNIATGQGTWQDWVGMAMMIAPVGQGKRELEDSLFNKDAEGRTKDAETTKDGDSETAKIRSQDGETPAQSRDAEAFEMGKDAYVDPYFDKGEVNVETQKTLEGQFTDYDCTATTLDMILKDMGYSNIERIDLIHALEQNFGSGVDMLNIPKAIENLGLDINTTSGKVSYEQLKIGLENGNSAVVSVNNGQGAHSVIIDRIENGQVTVRDPLPINRGSSYTIPEKTFQDAWGRFENQTGKVVIF